MSETNLSSQVSSFVTLLQAATPTAQYARSPLTNKFHRVPWESIENLDNTNIFRAFVFTFDLGTPSQWDVAPNGTISRRIYISPLVLRVCYPFGEKTEIGNYYASADGAQIVSILEAPANRIAGGVIHTVTLESTARTQVSEMVFSVDFSFLVQHMEEV